MQRRIRLLFPVLLAVASTSLAEAHPGHGSGGLLSGFGHPFSGWDHLLAMIAVGLWAAQLGGASRWLVPSAFVGAMTVGAIAGLAGLLPPGLDWAVVATVVLLGLIVAGAVRAPVAGGMILAGLGGVCHGLAHGAEMPATAGTMEFLVGMIFATAVLHSVGLAAAVFAGRPRGRVLRVAGAAVALAGTMMLFL